MKWNVKEVASLQPDYLGFIFYEKSPRNFTGSIPDISPDIKRVGVFVNADPSFIAEMARTHSLDVLQLHGDETADYCQDLKNSTLLEIWKVFGVRDTFDFSVLQSYENVVDRFLFDTQGKNKGGNGYTFDWSLLNDYPSKKSIVLSGGIGLEELPRLKELFETTLPVEVIDVNSRFEEKPGLKRINELKQFIDEL